MLNKHHGWLKFGQQPLNLHAGIQINIVERLVPKVKVCLLAQMCIRDRSYTTARRYAKHFAKVRKKDGFRIVA